jgi:hypothetical protein
VIECLPLDTALFSGRCELQRLCIDGGVVIDLILEKATVEGVYRRINNLTIRNWRLTRD